MQIRYDEDFLLKKNIDFDVDYELPLRLQKREILKKLGFPQNSKMKSCRVTYKQEIHGLLTEYSKKGYPFLIIVSEKPMLSLIPPLFIVQGKDLICWRNDKGVEKMISLSETLEEIYRFSSSTWIEFTRPLWGNKTIAGRLLYLSREKQILEIQEGIRPAQLMENKEYTAYSGEIAWLEIDQHQYSATVNTLKNLGYKFFFPLDKVKSLCEIFRAYSKGFERLLEISTLPTFEFAFTESRSLVSIDIDWPMQWIKKKGDEIID